MFLEIFVVLAPVSNGNEMEMHNVHVTYVISALFFYSKQ